MSKSRMVFEALMRDAFEEISWERRLRLGLAEDEREEMGALSLDQRVDLAGMASVLLESES